MKTKEMAPQDQNLVAVVTTKGNPKKDSANLGLPEHKWCPPSSPRQRQSSPKAKVTHVKPIRKYFWSKRSDEYLKKKEKARQEQKARMPKPREFISAMVQNWALTDVLSQTFRHPWSQHQYEPNSKFNIN